MNLHELAPVMGSTHVNKRKGRGSATGNGKTVEKVSLADVVAAARTVTLHSTYFLKGESQ